MVVKRLSTPEFALFSAETEDMLGLKQPDKKQHHQIYQRKSGRLEKYIIKLDQSLSNADPFDINHNSGDGTNSRLIHLQNKTIIPEDIQKNILETERRRELAYQTFVEERISGGDNLWSKMTKVKVFKWTAAAKLLKTNDAKQNMALAIQESSTMMARLLVITRSFRDIDPRIVISKHELSTINRLLMTPDGMLHPCSDKLIYKLESITCICDDLDGSNPDDVAPKYDNTCILLMELRL